ncbi:MULTISPECIES: nucleotide sugar dehydrogenase [Salinibaculum]|uniref:nucleotide sugar dehydrogenase n=1 Tax=Salinibaculum TaxID=2732368 RepID=UPI0030CC1672
MTGKPLFQRIADRKVSVGIIGLGYVGIPVSLSFTEAGFRVRGFDIDEFRIDELLSGRSYIDDVSDTRIRAALENGFKPSANPSVIADCDVYVLAVPTGINEGEPDMAAVEAATKTVAEQAGSRETLVVVTSTVYPGATRNIVKPSIEPAAEGPTYFAMVPERLNPGGDLEFSKIPLVVGADSEVAGAVATELFETVVSRTYPVESTDTAELAKTLENTYRMVNIALVNELVTFSQYIDADVWEAIDAAATKPFGFQPFRPGPGVGGHCIPIDPQFLTWRAENLGIELSLLNGAQRVNDRMPRLVANRIESLLRENHCEPEDASIFALGAAYKPNVGDTRNSPALQVIEALPDEAEVTIADPHADACDVSRKLVQTPDPENVRSADIVVLLVDHKTFDLKSIGEQASLIFDTRNAMPDDISAEVVTLGEIPERSCNETTRNFSLTEVP